MVVEIVRGYSSLLRQINERNAEEAYRNDKQNRNPILMRNMKPGCDEPPNNQ